MAKLLFFSMATTAQVPPEPRTVKTSCYRQAIRRVA